jgi:hypothetical protein
VGMISCWSGAACNMIDARPDPRELALRGFRVVSSERVGLFDVTRLRSAEPRSLTRGEVARLSISGPPRLWLQAAAD